MDLGVVSASFRTRLAVRTSDWIILTFSPGIPQSKLGVPRPYLGIYIMDPGTPRQPLIDIRPPPFFGPRPQQNRHLFQLLLQLLRPRLSVGHFQQTMLSLSRHLLQAFNSSLEIRFSQGKRNRLVSP